MTLLAAAAGCGERGAAPAPLARRDCSALVFFAPAAGVTAASVVGDWNGWTPGVDPMGPAEGGGLVARVRPPAGLHRYGIWTGSEIVDDPKAALALFDDAGAIERAALRIADCSRPEVQWTSIDARPDGTLVATASFLASDRGAPLASARVTLEDGRALETRTGGATITVRGSGLAPGKHRLTIEAADTSGEMAEAGRPSVWIEPAASTWHAWEGALVYQVIVDRYRGDAGPLAATAPIDAFHGGTLGGLADAVEAGELARLGVSALWISPAYTQPAGSETGADGAMASGYHGYWPTTSRAVEARLGGEAALERLVRVAHAGGIRVLLDVVPNHVHRSHPYAKADGWLHHPAGDCLCGRSCDWGTHLEDCWFETFLPDLAWERADVVASVTADTLWWLERFDLDGLRIDAVPMMPRLAEQHLRDAVRRAYATGARGAAPVHLLGETYVGRGEQATLRYFVGPNALSGQFDFPAMWALREVLQGRARFSDLEAETVATEAALAGGAVPSPIIGNHDVPRIASVAAGDFLDAPRTMPAPEVVSTAAFARTRLALTWLLSQPGAPVLFYGDEVGLPGAEDPDCRRDMRFGESVAPAAAALRDAVGALGRARAASPALRTGRRVPLLVEDDTYAYVRDAGDGAPALVVLHLGPARTLDLPLPADLSIAPGATFTTLGGAPLPMEGRTLRLALGEDASLVALPEIRR